MEQDGWTLVKAVPDTGAQVSVTPSDMAETGHEIKPTEASKAGRGFTSASKHKIPNLGELDVPMQSPEGHWTRQRWQVAPKGKLTRPLMSIGEECDNDSFVIFGKGGGAIVDQTSGTIRKFPRLANGAYEIQMWLPPPSLVAERLAAAGFTRQGA